MKAVNSISYDDRTGSLSGYYNYELNLHEVDRLITDHLQKKHLNQFQSIASGAIERLVAGRTTMAEGLHFLNHSIESIAKGNRPSYESYLAGSQKILQKHKRLGMKAPQEQLMAVVEEFLRFTRKYISIDLIYHSDRTNDNLCECVNSEKVSEDGLMYCVSCGRETVIVLGVSSYIDEKFIPATATPTTKERRNNFIKKVAKFEGKFKTKLPKGYQERLKDYFVRRDPDWNPPTEYSIEHHLLMLRAMDEISMNKFHDDVNLVCYECWGWPLPNLDPYRDQLMKDYDTIQPFISEYNRTNGEKSSDVNNDWRLWRHLHRLGLPYGAKRFRIPKTPDILRYYEEMWQWSCEKLNWPKPDLLRFV